VPVPSGYPPCVPIGRRRFLKLGAASATTTVGGCGKPPLVCNPAPASGAVAGFDGKIRHFIVLMLENRSYDHMLGALSGAEHDGIADGTALDYVDKTGARRTVTLRHGQPPDGFSPDPGHNFAAVADQMHGSGGRADMNGFVSRFLVDHPGASPEEIASYATIYGDGRLPVLHTLAKEFGVCSHWFCSLPGSTTPNRMFAHAGTSRGATRQGAYYRRVEGRMIFDRLQPKDWRVYFHDMPHLWLTGDGWTHTCKGRLRYMRSFEADVRSDDLATYTFIEPQHIVPPWSSQHPSAGVSHGERLIAEVYNTLVSSPHVFEKSLLLVVYDEHGGFYDHVVPPGHPGWNDRYPGIEHAVLGPDELPADRGGPDEGYAFTTLGPRVPAVVVSPWIERGSVFGWKAQKPDRRVTFDHTSILATVGAMTGVWVDSARARAATSLEVVATRDSPRADYPRRIPFDARAYADDRMIERAARLDEGVSGELRTAFLTAHGEATPDEMAAYFRRIVTA
jgi:phospholipase C